MLSEPRMRDPEIPVISNPRGAALTRAPERGYWFEHARQPVRFAEGIEVLLEIGVECFVELGPPVEI